MSDKIRNRFTVMGALRRALAAVLVITLLSGTLHATASTDDYYYVDLYDGKTATTVYTNKTNVKEIIAEAGIAFADGDSFDASRFTPGGEDSAITIIRPNLVGVNDERGTVYFTFDGTVAEAIEQAEVTVGTEDLINYNEADAVMDGMIISVARAFPVTVRYHGRNITLQMAVGTVGDAIRKAGVTIGKNDIVSLDNHEVVSSGMVIFIDEVVYKERTETKTIPFDSVTKEDASRPKGEKKVTTQGEAGQKEIKYKEKYVNGVLLDSVKVSETVTKKPVTQVTTVGTKKAYDVKAKGQPISKLGSVELDSNGVPKHYKQVFSGSGTAYTGGTGTATGRKPAVGLVAVDPKKIPYGSKLYIVATDGTVYGYAIAADTGGFIYDGRTIVDVYMDSYDDCVQWGRKNVNVYVLE